jgi:LCP family protein required for cell wall assembly
MGQGDDQRPIRGIASRHGRGSRVLAWAAIALTVVLVGGVLAAYTVYSDVFGKIRHVKVTGLGGRPPSYNRSLNILVIGSDTRSGSNKRFGAHVTGQRSDTVLVLHLSPGRRRAVVMSIPRDSVVPVLSCPSAPGAPGQTAAPGQVEQINATFSAGGPGCLWKTIEHTTGIRLDHFMELNFTGFERVVNDVGGVDICLPFPIHDPRSKLRLTAGVHHVMGPAALAYWRVRYIGQGSDLQRIQRDQYLMASLAQKVKRANLLGSPTKIFKVVSDIADALTTDAGLSQSAMIGLAAQLRSVPLSGVHFVQVPVVLYGPNPSWVQWAASARSLFQAIAKDRKLPRMRHQKPSAGQHSNPQGAGEAATAPPRPKSSSPAASAAGHTRGGQAPSLSGLSRRFGGITAGANVCGDSGAFAGPLGGH